MNQSKTGFTLKELIDNLTAIQKSFPDRTISVTVDGKNFSVKTDLSDVKVNFESEAPELVKMSSVLTKPTKKSTSFEIEGNEEDFSLFRDDKIEGTLYKDTTGNKYVFVFECERWVNIYCDSKGVVSCSNRYYPTKEAAISGKSSDGYVSTIKV